MYLGFCEETTHLRGAGNEKSRASVGAFFVLGSI
jgi:hypothetical protein